MEEMRKCGNGEMQGFGRRRKEDLRALNCQGAFDARRSKGRSEVKVYFSEWTHTLNLKPSSPRIQDEQITIFRYICCLEERHFQG
jgi:hypothetical protein